MHKVEDDTERPQTKIATVARLSLNVASTLPVTVGGFTLSFMNNNLGIKFTAKLLIDIGQNPCSIQIVYVADFLPCASTVRNLIQNSRYQKRVKFTNTLKSRMDVDWPATCDGFTHKKSGKKYCDFVDNYVQQQ